MWFNHRKVFLNFLIIYQCFELALAGVFDYEVKITSGNSRHLSHVAQFNLKSKLEIIEDSSHSVLDKDIFKFEDIHISTFNGDEFNETKNQKWEDLPNENPLYFAFMSEDQHGDAKIRFLNKDEDWSMNIKKSIVSLFNIPVITDELLKKRVFKLNQSDIYEKCENLYILDDTEDEAVIEVTRSVNNLECYQLRNSYHHLENVDLLKYNKNATDIKPVFNYRTIKYRLMKKGEQYKIQSITAETLVRILMHRNVEVSQYIKVYQTLTMTDDVDTSKQFSDFKDDEFSAATKIGYLMTSVPDLKTKSKQFMAAHKYLADQMTVKNVIVMLERLGEHYENFEAPEFHGAIGIAGMSELLFALRHMSSDQIYDVYKSLETDTNKLGFNFFKSVIGEVATDSNAVFIMKMYKENIEFTKKVLPKFVLGWNPAQSIKIQNMVETLMKEPNSFSIRVVSQLLQKTDYSLKEVKTVIEKLINGLKSSKSTEDQLTYLFALYNICHEASFNFILSIAVGEPNILEFPYNHHLQTHAVMTIEKFLQMEKGKDVSTEMFNIMTNPSNYLTLRVEALKVFLRYAPEEELILMSQYLIRHKSIDPNLYSYYYELLQSAVDDTYLNQKYSIFRKFAATELNNLVGKPESKLTRIIKTDYFDLELIDDGFKHGLYQITFSPIAENSAYVLYDAKFILKVEGRVVFKLLRFLHLHEFATQIDYNLEMESTLEYVYIRNEQVVEHMYVEDAYIEPVLQKFIKQLNDGFADGSTFKELLFPIDFGFLAHWEHLEPSFIDCSFSIDSSGYGAVSHKQWYNQYHKLNIFNPILKNKFGILDTDTFDIRASFEVSLNSVKNMGTIEFKLPENKTMGSYIGSHELTFVVPPETSYIGTSATMDYYSNFGCDNSYNYSGQESFPGVNINQTKYYLWDCLSDYPRMMANSLPAFLSQKTYGVETYVLQQTAPFKYFINCNIETEIEGDLGDLLSKHIFNFNINAGVKDLNGTEVLSKELFDVSYFAKNLELKSLWTGFENYCFNYSNTNEFDQIKSLLEFKIGQTSKECYNSPEIMATIKMTARPMARTTKNLKNKFNECRAHNKWSVNKNHESDLSFDCILAWSKLDRYEYEVVDEENVASYYVSMFILDKSKVSYLRKIIKKHSDEKTNDTESIEIDYYSKDHSYQAIQTVNGHRILYESKVDTPWYEFPMESPNMGYKWYALKNMGALHHFIIIPQAVDHREVKPISNVLFKHFLEASDEYQLVLRNESLVHDYCEILTKKTKNNQLTLQLKFKPNGYLTVSPSENGEYLTTMDTHLMQHFSDTNSDPLDYFGLRIVDLEDKIVIFLPELGVIIVYEAQNIQVVSSES